MSDLIKKAEKLYEIGEEYSCLFEEIMCEWTSMETKEEVTFFGGYFEKFSNGKYTNETFMQYNYTDFTPTKMPEGDKNFVGFISYLATMASSIAPAPIGLGVPFAQLLCPSSVAEDLRMALEEYFSTPKKFDYYSKEFRELRHKVFLRDGEICAKCGAIPKAGISLTIDHIKPVSKFPEMGLYEENLQVLCWPCNQGKSNKHETDYRK